MEIVMYFVFAGIASLFLAGICLFGLGYKREEEDYKPVPWTWRGTKIITANGVSKEIKA